ncbi:MAG TPA: hypothetical protein VHD62_14815 [Opitutaceae bacterium]|nr:hypothetical protein [Opitutaceae bacterium]
MKLFRLAALVGSSSLAFTAMAGDATGAIDPATRNASFAPAGAPAPVAATPTVDSAVQQKRVPTSVVEKQPAAVGDRRAPIAIEEARDKTVIEKDSRRPAPSPATSTATASAFDHRVAAISVTNDRRQPPLVSKYQDGMVAASAANLARFPAASSATGATINRFVFRHNAPDAAAAPLAATPAGADAAARN